jgi:hypothetical protein
MKTPIPFRDIHAARFARVWLSTFPLLVAFGCSGPSMREKQIAAMFGPPQPTLSGKATFLGGTLQAQVQLSGIGPGAISGEDGAMRPGGGQRPAIKSPMSGPGGMPPGSPPGVMGMPPGGPPSGGMGALPPEMLAQLQQLMRQTTVKPPRHLLRVKFTNTGPQTMEFAVTELASLLGNFAVRPERVALAPGQSVELEPMLSNKEGSYSRLDLRLALREKGNSEPEKISIALVTRDRS